MALAGLILERFGRRSLRGSRSGRQLPHLVFQVAQSLPLADPGVEVSRRVVPIAGRWRRVAAHELCLVEPHTCARCAPRTLAACAAMSVARPITTNSSDSAATARARGTDGRAAQLRLLRETFSAEFVLVDGETGDPVTPIGPQPSADWALRSELCKQAGMSQQPTFIADDDPLVTLAIPLAATGQSTVVAVATFATRAIDSEADLRSAASVLGLDPAVARIWLSAQSACPTFALERLALAAQARYRSEATCRELASENSQVVERISATYEEISLLYRLTQNLKLSSSDEQLARRALVWLSEVLPARGLAIQLLPVPTANEADPTLRDSVAWLTHGQCPLDSLAFDELISRLSPRLDGRPLVANAGLTGRDQWPAPTVEQLILVPLTEGEHLFGWLAAFNHQHRGEFGTEGAQLLASVATILGIHSGNRELYRKQAQLLSGVIRALTSAIDAKDPYTCGHSDRVARVAVRLGQELGLDSDTLRTIYLSGLLHDIGKIGVDDQVLRKPDMLTPAEFEHIKTHVEIGYNILVDLKQLAHVLPGVRHHHEAWDGTGYPSGLLQDAIPHMARIIAVADSYDAMGSDRPYRKGMDQDKLDQILKSGAGRQWDPRVVEAFFAAREEIREIAGHQPDGIDPDVPTWVRPHFDETS